jgi:signal transduction histidine kinase
MTVKCCPFGNIHVIAYLYITGFLRIFKGMDKGTMKEKGTGIGLHICQNLVRANKGQMEIDSRTNRETTITISLPVTVE